jgi:hypothetical protein
MISCVVPVTVSMALWCIWRKGKWVCIWLGLKASLSLFALFLILMLTPISWIFTKIRVHFFLCFFFLLRSWNLFYIFDKNAKVMEFNLTQNAVSPLDYLQMTCRRWYFEWNVAVSFIVLDHCLHSSICCYNPKIMVCIVNPSLSLVIFSCDVTCGCAEVYIGIDCFYLP